MATAKKNGKKKPIAKKKEKKVEREIRIPDPVKSEENVESKDGDNMEIIVPEPDDISSPDENRLRKDTLRLRKAISDNYWDLSEKLYKINEDGVYKKWGFSSLNDYVNEELDFQIRKARYYIAIQAWCRNFPEDIKNRIQKLGLTKAKLLANVFTEDNADEFLKMVEGMTTRQLEEFLGKRKSLSSTNEKNISNNGSSNVSDIEKTKRMSFNLFPEQFNNVKNALKKSGELSESEKEGHNLDLICTEFLNLNAGLSGIQVYLEKIESFTGVKLVAFDPKDIMIIYGSNTLNLIAGAMEEKTLSVLEEIGEPEYGDDEDFENPDKDESDPE